MRALCLIPDGPNYRRADFLAGLAAAGYESVGELPRPRPGDVLVIWNRSGWRNSEALRFEAGGASVLVAENGYMGKVWRGQKWFALAIGHHAGAGSWRNGGPARWNDWKVELAPWRDGGSEILILAQRGIGEPGVASPHGWAEAVQRRIGGRIRHHPGANSPAVCLEDDLAKACCVVTWHSAAAVRAITLGVPVFYDYPGWIGAGAARPLSQLAQGPFLGDRLPMLQRLAWAIWTDEEVRDGKAFRHLLGA